MKAAEFESAALDALRGSISNPEVLEAFDELVRHGLDSTVLHCAPGGRANARDFRFLSRDPRGWPFSITVGRSHLLFHVRPLGVRTLQVSRTQLARGVEVVRRRADTSLQVLVRNRAEAAAVVEKLLARWPSGVVPARAVALADARNGLGEFRANVEQIEGACRVTGVMDRRHLRVVHMKPWDACSDAERLDGNNGLLLSPHIAHLFERGYVTFTDDGGLRLARQLNSTVLKRWSIAQPRVTRAFAPAQVPYLAWHRGQVFEKAGSGRRRRD